MVMHEQSQPNQGFIVYGCPTFTLSGDFPDKTFFLVEASLNKRRATYILIFFHPKSIVSFVCVYIKETNPYKSQ